ncbi:voltage-dependent T-type calcium channel subunit alpha-1H-like, partial [Corvus kubaryi]|uniref:voltage-dependent T-type calcium channel subunit alpha-1H-like n=1 Tax=Corvus kubaryi TaxID=68294 RepID=UPI001C03F000
DTLRECTREDKHCLSYLPVISPVYFVTFVLIAQFVLVNVVVAVLMKHLEESNKEAKEDAEMDAEIELEMSRGTNAAGGSRGGAGAPESRALHGNQEHTKAVLQGKHQALGSAASLRPQDSQNLLTVRKISVARMHSLPNDSYMFRPVTPAKAPFPLHEVEMETYPCKAQRECPRSRCHWPRAPPATKGGTAGRPFPPTAPPDLLLSTSCSADRRPFGQTQWTDRLRSARTACKQSLESPSHQQSSPRAPSPPALSIPPLPATPPRSPPSSPHRPLGPLARKHTCGQHGVPSRPPSPDSPSGPEGCQGEPSDLADEEVRHINSSAKDWAEEHSDPSSRSTSPFTSPAPSPVPLKNCSTSSLSCKEKDLKKFYSTDTKGFLSKPSWADEQRRHSIEICPSGGAPDCGFQDPAEDKQRPPAHVQPEADYIHGARRKKKMSPPCISIDPPMEDDTGAAPRTKPSENTLLRRRTPSCEFPAYRESLELAESQPPCRGEHLSIPNFSFEQLDGGSLSSLSELLDSGQSTPASMDSRPDAELKKPDHLKTQWSNGERSKELLGTAKSPLRKQDLGPVTVATEEGTDDPV